MTMFKRLLEAIILIAWIISGIMWIPIFLITYIPFGLNPSKWWGVHEVHNNPFTTTDSRIKAADRLT